MVAGSSQWHPDVRCSDAADAWHGMGSSLGLDPSAYFCDYSPEQGDNMLHMFMLEHGDALREAFGIRHCEHRDINNSLTGKRRHYETVTTRDLAPDKFHADDEEGTCGNMSSLERNTSEQTEELEYITALSYGLHNHGHWLPAWDGHTEFAKARCGDPEDLGNPAEAELALRVAPLPHRTVVFEGMLLHRAAWPSRCAGKPAAFDGRYSTVLQLMCSRDRSIMKPIDDFGVDSVVQEL
jgi:hypothetical protein